MADALPLTAWLLAGLAGIGVGATGVGGVLIVPVLTAVGEMPVHAAIAAASFALLFPALAAQCMLSRQASGRGTTGLTAGALGGAALGALTLPWLPGAAIGLGVAALATASGAQALLARGTHASAAKDLPGSAPSFLLGLAVGCASAWSGTGGALVLLPLLMLLGVEARIALPLGQTIQLPITGIASLVNFHAGTLALALGAALGICLLLGWAGGIALGRTLPGPRLRQLMAVALLAAGLWYGWRVLQGG
ncbi:MAG: TSUP family transporter [Pigmentiphaga sp.]|uniref:TSUP family transporter n=1 Tax=Pigmentiphaga sp. TaxID=1977564 RepID=UPI0029A5AF06|nr:TSUP family transporter [Pigmentiphaga sp.]MDX3905657.1 TSUP family transporter [Pigmentiphaga sp.]